MAISFHCSSCNHKLKASEKIAGKKTKCPKCGHVEVIPAAQTLKVEKEDAPFQLQELSKDDELKQKRLKKELVKQRLAEARVKKDRPLDFDDDFDDFFDDDEEPRREEMPPLLGAFIIVLSICFSIALVGFLLATFVSESALNSAVRTGSGWMIGLGFFICLLPGTLLGWALHCPDLAIRLLGGNGAKLFYLIVLVCLSLLVVGFLLLLAIGTIPLFVALPLSLFRISLAIILVFVVGLAKGLADAWRWTSTFESGKPRRRKRRSRV